MVFVTNSNCFVRFGPSFCFSFAGSLFVCYSIVGYGVEYFLFDYFVLCLFVCYFAVANEKQVSDIKKNLNDGGSQYYCRVEEAA